MIRTTLALMLAAALLAAGCDSKAPPAGRPQGEARPELLPVPEPLLDPVEPAVRRQIQDLQGTIETLRQDPEADRNHLAETYGTLGVTFQAYELLDSAEACYENARRLDPQAPLWAYAAGRLARDHRGDLGSAVESLEAAAEGPRSALKTAALLHLGHAYLELDKPETAKASFRRVLADEPDSAAAHDGLGRVAVAAKEPLAAAQEFRRALELQPGASRVAYRLGQALRRAGRLEEAKAALAEQGTQEVSFPDPFEKLLAAAGTGTAALLRQGAQAQVAGRFDVAERLYRQAVEASPEDAAARLSLGAALAHLADDDGAVEQYRIAARLQPGNPVPPYNLGHLMIRRGDFEEAERQFERALAIEPGHLEARLGLAAVAERRRDFPTALARYQDILRDHPGNVEARGRRAVVLASGGRPREALEELQALVAAAPEEGEPRLHLGTLLAQQKRPEEARKVLRAALEKGLPPEGKARAEAYLTLLGAPPEAGRETSLGPYQQAVALLRQGRSVEARDLLELALPKDPGNPQLALALARVLAAAPDPEARDGRRALELAQTIHRVLDSPESSEIVAMALAEQERFEDAAQWQEKLVAKAEAAGKTERLPTLNKNLARYREGLKAENPWAR